MFKTIFAIFCGGIPEFCSLSTMCLNLDIVFLYKIVFSFKLFIWFVDDCIIGVSTAPGLKVITGIFNNTIFLSIKITIAPKIVNPIPVPIPFVNDYHQTHINTNSNGAG